MAKSIVTGAGIAGWSAKQLAATLNLPKTTLAQKPNYQLVEEKFRSVVSDKLSYLQHRENSSSQEAFIIHDGPPFANGDLHIGHALNKMLKDTILRFHLGQGRQVQLRPGWDCHGLPIELRALSSHQRQENEQHLGNLPSNTQTTDQGATAQRIRKACRQFAQEAQVRQQTEMKRWALLADYEDRILTMDPLYEANQLQIFAEFVRRQLVRRKKHPVHWSPSSRTALAEAELEYRDDHTSPACLVRFPIVGQSASAEFLLIWTTTPWTLPANQAIVYADSGCLDYCRVKFKDATYLVARQRLAYLDSELGQELTLLNDIPINDLSTIRYLDCQGKVRSLGKASFVTEDIGTGLVHVAPAYGIEDFTWYSQQCESQPPLLEIVDENGNFTSTASPSLHGKSIFAEDIIKFLDEKKMLVSIRSYRHRYPYDWRSKKPVIQMATDQWHIEFNLALRTLLLSALEGVEFHSPIAQAQLTRMIEARSNNNSSNKGTNNGNDRSWCISRQRLWGVPLPIFYHLQNNVPLLDVEVIEHVARLVRQHERGSDIWWEASVQDLLPPSYAHLAPQLRKGNETFDVWFDSGSFWATASPGHPADVVVEGVDQFRGWFQSSLVTAVVVNGKAPFRKLISHGFVLDERGAKMSKSLGNVISPQQVISPNQVTLSSKQTYRGVDVLRLWAITSDYTADITIGPTTLDQLCDLLQKFRNTFRFLLGNLADFHTEVVAKELRPLDCVFLDEFQRITSQVTTHFANYEFGRGIAQLGKFVREDLSTIYLDCIKNRLYLPKSNSGDRRSAQTVLAIVYDKLMELLQPVAPFLCAEVAHHCSVQIPSLQNHHFGRTDEISWNKIVELRNNVVKALQAARQSDQIESSYQAQLYLSSLPATLTDFTEKDLAELFMVESVYLTTADTNDGNSIVYQIRKSNAAKCPRCWIFQSPTENSLCNDCKDVLSTQVPPTKIEAHT